MATKPINAIIGIYISLVYIISLILGDIKFWSIIFSNPLPMETNKKEGTVSAIKVDQKKLETFTLKIQGSIFWIANGTPPINL